MTEDNKQVIEAIEGFIIKNKERIITSDKQVRIEFKRLLIDYGICDVSFENGKIYLVKTIANISII